MSTSTVKRSWLRNLINIITAIVALGAEMFSVIFRQYLGMRIQKKKDTQKSNRSTGRASADLKFWALKKPSTTRK